jgi:SAM-dependent methyltransferase
MQQQQAGRFSGPELKAVQAFWNTEACDTQFITNYADKRDFFAKYRAFRYRSEWHIPLFARFDEARDKSVLEIGCGNGADGAMFALHGARYTGVDLTEEAVEATRQHFAFLGLGGEFQCENAEQLGFADDSFDIVYSFGVLHHTPNPQRAVDEVHRVLRPGGSALVMLYHRHSFNYWVRIQTYMRARALLTILARARRWSADREKAEARDLIGLRGNASPKIWQLHYENFLRQGWSYLRAEQFAHHCADGPECPIAYTYSARQAARLFGRFRAKELSVAYFPVRNYPLGRLVPRSVEGLLGRAMGWHLLVRATK